MITPYGGVRRNNLDVRVGGVLANPFAIKIDVYVNGLNTADVTLSTAATASVAQRATGLYTYEYSVGGLGAGSQIRELISIKVEETDEWAPSKQSMTVIAALAQAEGLTADTMCIKLTQGSGCC